MAWHFEGTGLDITMGTTRSGTVQVNGNGIQLCRPSAGDMRVIKLVDAIAGLFTIGSSAAAPIDYDGAGFGLKEFYEQEPDQSAAMIVYYAADSGMPAAVGASIIVPSAHMTSVLEMAKTLIGRPDLRYVTTIDFLVCRSKTHTLIFQPTVSSPQAGFMNDAPISREALLST